MKKKISFLGKILCAVILFYPLLFFFTGSIMGKTEINEFIGCVIGNSRNKISWTVFPKYPTIKSYIELLFDTPEFIEMFWNSIKYTCIIIIGQVLVAVPTAWALVNINIKWKKCILVIYGIVMIMPFQVRMLPEYLVLKDLNLLNSVTGIVLPEIFSTLPVMIMYYCFLSQSKSMIENAKIDGASEWRIFVSISVPNALPGVATCVVLAILEYWNMIEQPLIFLSEKSKWPLALLTIFDNKEMINVLFAMASVLAMFILIVFLCFQKYFEEGISLISKE